MSIQIYENGYSLGILMGNNIFLLLPPVMYLLQKIIINPTKQYICNDQRMTMGFVANVETRISMLTGSLKSNSKNENKKVKIIRATKKLKKIEN